MKIYNSWYLQVSSEHSLYFECKGDSRAQPILFLHGWPGLWCSEQDEVFFTNKDNVIFFDQRGSWKSQYSQGNILHENNMNTCVSDILMLLKQLWISGKIILFWWSWWSTLALTFSIRNPERVKRLILRWVYLAGEKVEEDFCFGNWNEAFFPEAWEWFLAHIPIELHNEKKELSEYIWVQAQEGNYLPLNALLLFEYQTACLDPSEALKQKPSRDIHEQSLLEYWFIYNSCFIEKDYILENITPIKDIPVNIVQGRYDNVCPPRDAYALSQKLHNCSLEFVVSWHTSHDSNTIKALQDIIKAL